MTPILNKGTAAFGCQRHGNPSFLNLSLSGTSLPFLGWSQPQKGFLSVKTRMPLAWYLSTGCVWVDQNRSSLLEPLIPSSPIKQVISCLHVCNIHSCDNCLTAAWVRLCLVPVTSYPSSCFVCSTKWEIVWSSITISLHIATSMSPGSRCLGLLGVFSQWPSSWNAEPWRSQVVSFADLALRSVW